MLDTGSTRSRRRISVRTFFSLIILAALLPPLFLLAMVIVRTAESDRKAAEASLIDSANVIASMVHGTLLSDIEMIRTIGRQAHSRSRAGEHPAELNIINRHFSGRASIVATQDIGMDVIPPWSLTNLIDIQRGQSAKLTYKVPLDVGPTAILTLTADSSAVSHKISFGDVAASGMLVAVVDGNGNMVTRSVAAQENLGKPVPTWQALLDVGAPSGAFNAIAFDGTPISFGFATIESTPGWVVVVGVPKAILDARWQNPLIAFAFGTGVALIVAVMLALLMSRRITDPISAMVKRSEAIASDSKAPCPRHPTRSSANWTHSTAPSSIRIRDWQSAPRNWPFPASAMPPSPRSAPW